MALQPMFQGFHIGSVAIPSPLIMAPLAGYTCSCFRRLVKEAGCGLVFTEAISAKGLCHKNQKTHALMRFDDCERPLALQLLASEPDDIIRAIRIIEAEPQVPDLIDINLGCPKPKITRKCEGGALLAQTDKALALVKAACSAASRPVTVKIRLLEQLSLPAFCDVLKAFEDAGAAAITLHPRTVAERFRNKARWSILEACAQAVAVPFIASGDVKNADHAATLLSMGLEGVMIGRAAIGDPLIFRRITQALTGKPVTASQPLEQLALCRRHLNMLKNEIDETMAVYRMRKHYRPYLRGLTDAKRCIRELIALEGFDRVDAYLSDMIASFQNNGQFPSTS